MINGNACFAYFNKIWGIPVVEPVVLEFLNSRTVIRWAEVTLGL